MSVLHGRVASPFDGLDLGPRPHLGYTASALERAAERRTDAAFLAASEAEATAGAYAIAGELVVLQKRAGGFDPLFEPAAARALGATRETVFLGLAEGAGRFGIGIDVSAVETLKGLPDLQLIDLRSIAINREHDHHW
ncbi:MAG TPA: hypothetical protein VHG27_05840, partial [Xanthobacteraceae bacterium]|nr:hypothetical protein [Xanthobacteraceae bacterium]